MISFFYKWNQNNLHYIQLVWVDKRPSNSLQWLWKILCIFCNYGGVFFLWCFRAGNTFIFELFQIPKVVILDPEVCLRIHYFFRVSKFPDIQDSFKHSQVEQIQIFPEVSTVVSRFWNNIFSQGMQTLLINLCSLFFNGS